MGFYECSFHVDTDIRYCTLGCWYNLPQSTEKEHDGVGVCSCMHLDAHRELVL